MILLGFVTLFFLILVVAMAMGSGSLPIYGKKKEK